MMFNLIPVGEACLKAKMNGLIPLVKQDIQLNACLYSRVVSVVRREKFA